MRNIMLSGCVCCIKTTTNICDSQKKYAFNKHEQDIRIFTLKNIISSLHIIGENKQYFNLCDN